MGLGSVPRSTFYLVLLALFNIGLLLHRANRFFEKQPNFSYVGDDYPIELPISHELEFVAMTLQENTHTFALNASDPIADKEWHTIITNPLGMGRVHLGENQRLLTVTFWHQLHCVREMVRAAVDRNHPEATPGHIEHCLTYLRQSFLCDADYSLERGDFLKRDFESDSVGDNVVCRDWDAVYRHLGEQTVEWVDWKNAQGTGG